jgi:hypothetical protein
MARSSERDRDRIEELEAKLSDIKDMIDEVLDDSDSDQPRKNPFRR